MGSFVFSNTKLKNVEKSKSLLLSKGHKEVSEYFGRWGHLLSANKILVESQNYIEFPKNNSEPDFIIGIGTFIYKGNFGERALKSIYNDFQLEIATEDFPIFGHFAFVIKKDNKVYVFNDNEGSQRLFYTISKGNYIISNSEFAGVVCNMEIPRINKGRISAFINGKIAAEIPFVEGVHFLNPKTVLVFDVNGSVIIETKSFPAVPRIETTEEAVSYCKNLFKSQLEMLKAFQEHTFSIELTGGLDSRLVAANINSAGFKYDFVNYGLYGADSEIAKIVSSGMNKRLVMIDDPKDYDFENEIGEFDLGFNYFRHYPSKRWSIPNIIQFSGLYGECLTMPEIYTDSGASKESPTISKLLPKLVLSDIMTEESKASFLRDITEFFIKEGFDPDKLLTEKEQDQFTRIISPFLSGDYMFVSACNTCMYFYSIYNEWHFSHFITDISFLVKDCRKLSIALIRAIDKEVGSYPFVSRLRTRRNSVNEVTELPAVYKSYNWLKENLPKCLVNYIYGRVGRTFPKDYIKQINFEKYQDVIDVNRISKYPNVYYGTIKSLYSVEVVRNELGI